MDDKPIDKGRMPTKPSLRGRQGLGGYSTAITTFRINTWQ